MSRTVLVTGDVVVDRMLSREQGEPSTGAGFDFSEKLSVDSQTGGCALLADLLREMLPAGPDSWHVLGPTGSAAAETLPNSYAIWKRYPRKKGSAHRIDRFIGFQPGTASGAPPAPRHEDPLALQLVLDQNLEFRSEKHNWPGTKPWTILKTQNPFEEPKEWQAFKSDRVERLIIVVTAKELRASNLHISHGTSWERTAQDVWAELQRTNEHLGLLDAAHTIVLLPMAGAVVLTAKRCSLVFDPHNPEGRWERAHDGRMSGYNTCLLAAIANVFLKNGLSSATAETRHHELVQKAVPAGLAMGRWLHEEGHTAAVHPMRFPSKQLASLQPPEHKQFFDVEVQSRDTSPDWCILTSRPEVESAAANILREGLEEAIKDVPVAALGKLQTIDRGEIEALHAIETLIRDYIAHERDKPLSIGVFGPPGSGKSFGVTQVATAVGDDTFQPKTFNLSQLSNPDALIGAFHQVRDIGLAGKVPLVFWDEFDSALQRVRLGWLRYFLAPMQDGTFQEGQVTHPIGRAIFVFAGGTRPSAASFFKSAEEEPDAKGPDFTSRLRGVLDVRGPDRVGSDDAHYLVRRAIILRALLKRHASRLFAAEKLRIDPGVLRALTTVSKYKHGARSMESIRPTARCTAERHSSDPACRPGSSSISTSTAPSFSGWSSKADQARERGTMLEYRAELTDAGILGATALPGLAACSIVALEPAEAARK